MLQTVGFSPFLSGEVRRFFKTHQIRQKLLRVIETDAILNTAFLRQTLKRVEFVWRTLIYSTQIVHNITTRCLKPQKSSAFLNVCVGKYKSTFSIEKLVSPQNQKNICAFSFFIVLNKSNYFWFDGEIGRFLEIQSLINNITMKLSLTPPRLMFLFLKTEHLWNHLPFNANFCVVTNMETKSLVRSVTVIVWLEFDPFMNICRLSDHAEKSYNSFFWQAVLKVQRIGGLFLSEICCDVFFIFLPFFLFFCL